MCKATLLGIDDDCVHETCDITPHNSEEQKDDIDRNIRCFEGALRDEKAALATWRKEGPIGNLDNRNFISKARWQGVTSLKTNKGGSTRAASQ